MFRRLALSAVSLVGFAAVVTAGTLAVFSDQEAIGANAFSAGTVDLGTSPTTAVVALAGMMPGDTVTNPLVVTNQPGSGALRYAVSSTATDTDGLGLKDQLVLTVKTGDSAAPTSCAAFSGTQLYSGDMDSTAGMLVGDAAQGAQSGDRTLDAGADETLCFRVSLPLDTGNSFKNAASTATFTFDAEQTANNP